MLLLLAGHPRNTVSSQSRCQVAEGGPCGGPAASLQYTLTGPVGQPFASCPGGAAVRVPPAPICEMYFPEILQTSFLIGGLHTERV
jgi:hypothetical protein